MPDERPPGREPRPSGVMPTSVSWKEGATWLSVIVVVTWALVGVRARIGAAHVTLAYLLIVLAASARCGRRIGLASATLCFLAFNFYFVPPFGTLEVHDPLDWLVLLAFMTTSAVAAQLLHRAQSEAESARRGAFELQRLATLGAEALQAPRAEDAVMAIARVTREELQVQSCELYMTDGASGWLHLVARATPDGVSSPARDEDRVSAADVVLAAGPRTLLIPLHVRSHQVGLLKLQSPSVIPPDAARHPFAEALSFYAALGLERIRLTTEAAHAESLREIDRLKDAVLSAVSHDLRTPLTAIKAVAREIADGGETRAVVVEREADRLNTYVTNLLDLSRLNAGTLPVTLELVPIDELLGAVLPLVATLSAERNVRVDASSTESLLVGRMDFGLTLRALTNILENAVRYSPPLTVISLDTCEQGPWLRISVSDRGPGIALEDRDRVFEPFERGGGVQDTPGTGLGLSIARRFVEAQGGTVAFSPRERGGTVFTISVPAADAASLAE